MSDAGVTRLAAPARGGILVTEMARSKTQREGVSMLRLLLTPEEAAESIGVGRSKMYELLRCGAIPSIKIGALRRVPVQALQEYVESLMAG